MKRGFLMGVATAAVLFGIFLFVSNRCGLTQPATTQPLTKSGTGPSATAPDFTLMDLNGKVVRLSDLRGKPVVVNFWATWCPPCRLEMPSFQRIYDAHRAQGFTIVGVSMDAAGSDAVRRFLVERHIQYPVAMASGEVVQDFGGVALLPTSFLIDREGRTRYEVRGIFAPIALERAVDKLLADGAPTDTSRRVLR